MLGKIINLTGCIYLKQIWRGGLDNEPTKYYEPCSFNYQLKVIEFNNPDDLKDTNRIELCEVHFHEVFDKYLRPEAIAESKYNSEFKKVNLMKVELKESKDWEVLRQFSGNPNVYKKQNDLKVEWDYLKYKKCHNDMCANELQGSGRKIFSVLIFNKRGGLERKLNLCSYQCWNKIRYYIGIIRLKEPMKAAETLEIYF